MIRYVLKISIDPFCCRSEGLTEQLLFIIINTDAAIACRLFLATGDVPYYSPHIKTERAATHFLWIRSAALPMLRI